MFFRRCVLAAIMCLAGFSCGDKSNPAAPPVAGPTELEGVWAGYSDADNPPYPLLIYTFKNNTIVVQRDSCTPQGASSCTAELYRGTFVLDTSASPKTIDIHVTQSSNSAWVNKTIPAVYFKFANNVNISANEPGSARPTASAPPSIDSPAIHLGQ